MVGREGPTCPRRHQGHRTGQGAGLSGQRLQVVVEQQRLVAPVHQALVAGHDGAPVGDRDLLGAERHLQALADQRHRHRVAALAHADPRLVSTRAMRCRAAASKGSAGSGASNGVSDVNSVAIVARCPSITRDRSPSS